MLLLPIPDLPLCRAGIRNHCGLLSRRLTWLKPLSILQLSKRSEKYMDNIIKNKMNNMDFTNPAKIDDINALEENLGAEGAIGKENYLALWSVNEIVDLNVEYAVKEFTPQLTYFGSDGGEMAYAFDTSNENIAIVEIPFESIDIEDKTFIADDFYSFIDALAK